MPVLFYVLIIVTLLAYPKYIFIYINRKVESWWNWNNNFTLSKIHFLRIICSSRKVVWITIWKNINSKNYFWQKRKTVEIKFIMFCILSYRQIFYKEIKFYKISQNSVCNNSNSINNFVPRERTLMQLLPQPHPSFSSSCTGEAMYLQWIKDGWSMIQHYPHLHFHHNHPNLTPSL